MGDMVVVTMARVHEEAFSSRPRVLMTALETPKQVKTRAALWPYFHEGGKYLAERREQLMWIHVSHPAIS